MNNLTTRKIVLGVLMTLVLAFSVQGIADALTFGTTRTGNLKTTVSGNELTISFSVSLKGNTSIYTTIDGKRYLTTEAKNESNIIDSSGYRKTKDGKYANSSGQALSDTDDDDNDGTPDQTDRDAWVKVSNDVRYHYNQEAIAINAAPEISSLRRKIGSRSIAITQSTSEAALSETSEGDLKLSSGTITLTCSPTGAGEYVITIYDVTPAADLPNGAASKSRQLSFTVYVVPSSDYTTSIGLESAVDNGHGFGNDNGDPPISTHFSKGQNSPIIYRVEGPGWIFVKETYTGANASPNSVGSAAKEISTSANANVFLDMSGGSNKVTVWPRDRNPTQHGKSVTYIFNYAEIEIISGNNQTGVPNARLINPLAIRVKDSKGRALSGLAVTFNPSSEETLQPVIGTDVYLTETNAWAATFDTINRTFQATTAVPIIASDATDNTGMVPTDSRGEAEVYLKLGSASETAKTVDVGAGGAVNKFYATSSTSTDIPSLEILSGNNQRSASDGKVADPLMVRVLASQSSPLPEKKVTFTTTKGYLTTPTAYQRTGDGGTSNGPATQVTAVTDVNGKAAVTYDLVNHSGASDVIAEISGTAPTYSRRVTFTINGTGSTAPPTTTPPTTTPGTTTLQTSPTSISGAPGSTQTLTITGGTGIQVGPSATFATSDGDISTPTTTGGTTTATITLPTTVGAYSVFVRATGQLTVEVPITVTTSPTTTVAALTPSSTTISGAPGSQQRIIATARNAAGNPVEDVPVTFSIVGFASRTQNTDVLGTALWNFTLPATAGPYTLNITATGYESATVSLTVGGTAPTPTPVPGIRLVRADGNNQTGEPGTRLSSPLVVTVVDSNNRGVSGQLVQFTATRGGGRVSPTSATTTASGQAQTTLILGRTAGTNTVAATLNGSSVTFTATAETAPALMEIYSGNNQRGILNTELENELVVVIEDDNGNGVEDIKVTFRVTTGQARLSQRGTGRAVAVYTDGNGMAETPLTPTGAGTITVRATANGLDPVTFTILTGPPPASIEKASGDNQAGNPGSRLANPLVVEVQDAEGGPVSGVTVTFDVTAGGGSISDASAKTNAQGQAQTNLTLGRERGINSVSASVTGLDTSVTFNTSIEPKILVAAANRPVMYWIDSGALYALAGAKATRIAASANDVAVDAAAGKVYWIEKTGDTTGRVHSANVDGTSATVVKNLTSVPMGLALDSANGKLYLTNSWGKIQRMNVNGTQFETNLVVGLTAPQHIAVGGGNIYWTEASGNVRSASIAGAKTPRTIATGMEIGGIAVGSSKVYWTEKTSNVSGAIRSANHDGTAVANLFTLTAVPKGIALTAAGSIGRTAGGKSSGETLTAPNSKTSSLA